MDTTADAYLYAGVRMMNWGDVPTWLQAGSTIVLVGITAYYAWQNKRMADHNARMVEEIRRQSQIQLYERRASILRGVLRCLGLVIGPAQVKGEVIPCLLEATSEQEYLLKQDLCDYLDVIYKKCVEAYVKKRQQEQLLASDPVRSKLLYEESELVGWLVEQPKEVRRRFLPYLKVEDTP